MRRHGPELPLLRRKLKHKKGGYGESFQMKPTKSYKSAASPDLSRRHFIKINTLATGAIVFGVPTLLRAANLNSRLNIASIGVMGKGQTDTDCCDTENIVALCDVDSRRCAP